MRGEVEKVLRALVTDGALASQACKIVSEFNDKMVRRVIRLAEGEVGSPPSSYTWLGLGSEGRKEQTLLTDQDNAIIFSDPSSEDTGLFPEILRQGRRRAESVRIPSLQRGGHGESAEMVWGRGILENQGSEMDRGCQLPRSQCVGHLHLLISGPSMEIRGWRRN